MNTKARILIVDDEEVVRLSFMRVLAATHCEVHAVSAWSQIAQDTQLEPFDVVLLDLRMPDTDGISVLKAVKRRWPESEVILITGYGTLESAKEAMVLGACDYLLKPVGPEQVIDACRAALQHKRWALHNEASPGHEASGREILPKLRLGCRSTRSFKEPS
jgi:two-component system response regulator AtoC